MSIIVAVKGEGCVYLAADSQVTFGESKLILDPRHGKLRQLTPQLAVGCTENINQLDVFTIDPCECNIPPSFDVIDCAALVWKRVVAGLGDRMEKNRDTGAAELPGRLLVAWKDDFIEVDAGGQLIKPASDWHAIGSGADVARAALLVSMWDAIKDPARLADRGVSSACECNIYCSLPVITAVTRV